MAPISKDTVARSLSAHAAIGLIASILLYLVCLTGTIVVFYQEWQRIEQPNAPEMSQISPQAVQSAVQELIRTERGKAVSEHLFVHLPVEGLPRTTLTSDHQAVHVDSSGKIAMPEENAFSEFLLALHYRLNLPAIIGMSIVGALGVAIVALSITGVIAHPRIFRDAFRLRMRDKNGVGLADWHNRLGVWTLPFTLAIALTGSLIGLSLINARGLGAAFYEGQNDEAFAPVFGEEPVPAITDRGIPNIATALEYMAREYPDTTPTYVILHEPLTEKQHVQIVAKHPQRLIFGEYYNFDARGDYLGSAGLSDGKIGQQLAASTYDLHFGTYGGLTVKILYFIFGLCLTVVTATGVSIWFGKRIRRGVDSPRLRNGWNAVVWGVPLALSFCLIARVLFGNGAPLTAIFWISSVLIVAFAIVAPVARQPVAKLDRSPGGAPP